VFDPFDPYLLLQLRSFGYRRAFDAKDDVTLGDRPFVSVIIPVFNDQQRLMLCLKALDRQTYPREYFEVIVIDNGSRDEIIRDPELLNGFRYFKETTPGSGAARNAGILQARGEIIAFTDSDCIPAPGWIEKGVESLLNGNNDMVGGRIDYHFGGSGKLSAAQLYDHVIYLDQERHVKRYHFFATANLFVKRKLFDACGFFDARLKYASDVEWTQRAFFSGFRQGYADQVVVSHEAKARLTQILKRAWKAMESARFLKRDETDPRSFFACVPLSRRTGWLIDDSLYALQTRKLDRLTQRIKVVAVIFLCGIVRIILSVKCWMTDRFSGQNHKQVVAAGGL